MRNQRHVAYARHALVAALRMSGIGAGSRVLVPDFICRDVLASFRAVGTDVSYYGIGPDLQIRPGQVLPRADALLAVNFFGFPADIARLREASGDETMIIEDNAHGWLSSGADGVALGSRTPLSITSIRKTIFAPDGALLEWESERFPHVAPDVGQSSPRHDPLGPAFRVRSLASGLERTTRLPVRHVLRTATRLARRTLGRPPIDDRPQDEEVLPDHDVIHAESLRRFARVDPAREAARRRELFARCLQLAVRYGVSPVIASLPAGVVPMGFPFFHGHGDERRFTSNVHLRAIGEVISWPALPASTTLPDDSPLRSLRLVNFL